jgi:hypothetical protein
MINKGKNNKGRMTMTSFLVNYGGPTTALSTMSSQFEKIIQDCKAYYGGTAKATGFTIKGLDVTYYQMGIHRMIKVELPDTIKENLKSTNPHVQQQARQTMQLYTKVRSRAGDFNTTGYKLLGNNCVSAVANVLNTIDPTILEGKKKIIPQFLDAKVKECTKLQSMVYDAIGGSLDTSDSVPTKPLYSGGVPEGIWQDAMSTTKNSTALSQQTMMKNAMKTLKQGATDDLPLTDTPKSP